MPVAWQEEKRRWFIEKSDRMQNGNNLLYQRFQQEGFDSPLVEPYFLNELRSALLTRPEETALANFAAWRNAGASARRRADKRPPPAPGDGFPASGPGHGLCILRPNIGQRIVTANLTEPLARLESLRAGSFYWREPAFSLNLFALTPGRAGRPRTRLFACQSITKSE